MMKRRLIIYLDNSHSVCFPKPGEWWQPAGDGDYSRVSIAVTDYNVKSRRWLIFKACTPVITNTFFHVGNIHVKVITQSIIINFLLREKLPDRLISLRGDQTYPLRFCHSIPCDFFSYRDTLSHEFTSTKYEMSRNTNEKLDVFSRNLMWVMVKFMEKNITCRALRGVIRPILFFMFKLKFFQKEWFFFFFYGNKFD